ncbi:MAG TPA: hypothetical protein VHK27_11715, partial [Gammaproteobacteria bacterium]|nr:hypothetical protein [Gammaproteobacteria bacterium]
EIGSVITGTVSLQSEITMLRPITFVSSYLFVAAFLSAGQAFSATRLEPLTVGYSNITATYAPLWITVEERRDPVWAGEAIYAGRVRPQQSLALYENYFIRQVASPLFAPHGGDSSAGV